MSWGPFGLAGKSAIITGGAMGIGFGIAERFLEAGANVLIADLDEEALDTATGKLAGQSGGIDALRVDVGDDDAGEQMVERCVAAFGGMDILVNNAGIFPSRPVLEMTPEFLDRVYRVNLRGLVLASKAAGARMVSQGTSGKIVNVASIDAVHPSMPGLAAYDASKGGVLMFTRNFALEMAPHGVNVNAIAPGGVRTEGTSRPLDGSGMTSEQMSEVLTKFARDKVPLGRIGEPDDIATVAVFLASPASSYMTGSLVVVDGGTLLM